MGWHHDRTELHKEIYEDEHPETKVGVAGKHRPKKSQVSQVATPEEDEGAEPAPAFI